MKRKDVNQIAFETLQQAIGAMPKGQADRKAEAAKLGRKGGLKGGAVRAQKLSTVEKTNIAKHAAELRWAAKAKGGS